MTQELLEQQEIKLPLTGLHNKFGICFDKKDTYTITELDREDFKGTITINNVIKTAGVDLSKDTEVVVILSYKNLNYFNGIAICSFNINKEKKTVNSYMGVCNKGDVTTNLKEAIKVVVVEVTKSSLKFPEYNNQRDLEFYESRNFNCDFNLTERVKFSKKHNCKYIWNEEKEESIKVPMADEEMRNKSTYDNIYVQFLSGGTLNLRMTWGRDNEETWGDIIDKSGYNVKAQRINLNFKLKKYKADKVKKRIKDGNLLTTQADVINKIKECKVAIGNTLLTHPSTLEELTEQIRTTEDKLHDLRWIMRNFKEVNEHINEAIAGNDYERNTLDIEDDLKDIQDKLDKILNEER